MENYLVVVSHYHNQDQETPGENVHYYAFETMPSISELSKNIFVPDDIEKDMMLDIGTDINITNSINGEYMEYQIRVMPVMMIPSSENG